MAKRLALRSVPGLFREGGRWSEGGTLATHNNDTSVATSDAIPQTIIVAFVNLEPVPSLDASWGISNNGEVGGKFEARVVHKKWSCSVNKTWHLGAPPSFPSLKSD